MGLLYRYGARMGYVTQSLKNLNPLFPSLKNSPPGRKQDVFCYEQNYLAARLADWREGACPPESGKPWHPTFG